MKRKIKAEEQTPKMLSADLSEGTRYATGPQCIGIASRPHRSRSHSQKYIEEQTQNDRASSATRLPVDSRRSNKNNKKSNVGDQVFEKYQFKKCKEYFQKEKKQAESKLKQACTIIDQYQIQFENQRT